MKTRAFLSTILLGALLTGCAGPELVDNIVSTSPRVMRRGASLQVPLGRALNGQFLVHATVNGQDGLFALDTGAAYTILTPQFVSKLKLPVQTVRIPTALNSGSEKARLAQVKVFSLGGLDCINFQAPILNLDHLNRAGQLQLDGIIGNNLFGTSACIFDWHNRTLTLNSRETSPPPGAIPITVRSNRVFFAAVVNGQPAEFALDTGSYCSLLAQSELARLKIDAFKTSQATAMVVDIHEARETKQARVVLDSLKFGNIDRADFPVLVWNHNVIGMDLLEPCVLTLDTRRNWMTLTPPAAPPR